jgi:cytochrome c biogenesis protein CcmG/thiol:disulfide interchange protein DsbE
MGSMRARVAIFIGAIVLVVAVIVGLAVALGGSSEKGDSKGGIPPANPAFDSAPAPIRSLHADRSRLLGGGAPAFEKRVASLEGHPVVVNKWASWCGPCRGEFPVFQKAAVQEAKNIGFIGVDSTDNDADALKFLGNFPLPYPSYRDPDLKVAKTFNGIAAFPTTAFYDAKGKLQYTHQGPYKTVDDLLRDVRRYTS